MFHKIIEHLNYFLKKNNLTLTDFLCLIILLLLLFYIVSFKIEFISDNTNIKANIHSTKNHNESIRSIPYPPVKSWYEFIFGPY